ncbi:MAG: thymidine phosphorylase [Bacillota bacterium]|jgi:pyrimidine-nucleoside phosphorylase
MNITDLIHQKKNGKALGEEEIAFFVRGYTDGTIPDYQASALLMAIWFAGMTAEETFALTAAMKNSGDTLDLSGFERTIDKHSTGGIGDKLSLIVLPLWRAGGLNIAKMSGRGLGFTGGTIDKLESVPGYDTSLDQRSFFEHLCRYGIVVAGQSASLVPADKKLYALRDVTETVDSLPLIAASVMSKKLATAAENIVLDVKYGESSFMKTKEDARKLAELMVKLGESDGRRVAALLSPMSRPLGRAVGNAVEVKEAYRFLRGEGEGELKENALALAAAGFVLAGLAADVAAGRGLCETLIQSGAAADAFFLWLKSQGGRFDESDFEKALAYPAEEHVVSADKDGVVRDIHGIEIGLAGMELGAGRKKLGDAIDPAAGVLLRKTVGETVRAGEPLAVLRGAGDVETAIARVRRAFVLGETAAEPETAAIEVFNGKKWEIMQNDND